MSETASDSQQAQDEYEQKSRKLQLVRILLAAAWATAFAYFAILPAMGEMDWHWERDSLNAPMIVSIVGIAAMFVGTVLLPIYNRKGQTIRSLLPRFLPDSTEAAFRNHDQVLEKTRMPRTLCQSLITTAVALAVLAVAFRSRLEVWHLILISPVLWGCIFVPIYLLPLLKDRCRNAAIQLSCCQEPAYRDVVREFFGPEAEFDIGFAKGDRPPPPYEGGNLVIYQHAIRTVSNGCPVLICDAQIVRHNSRSVRTVFDGIYVQIRTGRTLPLPCRMHRVESSGRGPYTTDFDAVFTMSKEARPVFDDILTGPMKEQLADSLTDRLCITDNGVICFGLAVHRMIRGSCESAYELTDSIRRFRLSLTKLQPLIAILSEIRDSPDVPKED